MGLFPPQGFCHCCSLCLDPIPHIFTWLLSSHLFLSLNVLSFKWPSLTVAVTKCKFVCPMHPEAKQYWNVWSRERFIAGPCKEMGGSCPKNPNSPKGFNKASLKVRWERGLVSCCRLLGVGILCSGSCPRRSGHDVPVNLQQDKCYSLFCNFLSLNEWKSVTPLKVRALRKGYPVYFRL